MNLGSTRKEIQHIIPGLLLSFATALVSKVIAGWLPTLGAATIAILLGILLGNTIFRQPVLAAGTKFSESKLLEVSVVLLGITVTFQTISQIGFKGVAYILLIMTGTILGTWFIGRRLGFSKRMVLLMAGGNAVCGSSAIASIAPVIRAKEEEKGQIITLVNLLGTVMMLLLPVVGTALYRGDLLLKSALIGGTLQSVGQVVASASMISEESAQLAMLFKIMRIMLLVVVVYVFGKLADGANHSEEEQKVRKKLPVPWYVLGFLVLCILNSLVHLQQLEAGAHFISSWFEITALAAIGLRLDFQKFFKEGKRFLIFGLSVGAIQIVLAIFLLSVLF